VTKKYGAVAFPGKERHSAFAFSERRKKEIGMKNIPLQRGSDYYFPER